MDIFVVLGSIYSKKGFCINFSALTSQGAVFNSAAQQQDVSALLYEYVFDIAQSFMLIRCSVWFSI